MIFGHRGDTLFYYITKRRDGEVFLTHRLLPMPSTAMLILPTVMLPAGMSMLVSVVVTVYIGVESQISGQICLDGIIRHAGYASVQLDPCFRQGHLRSAADSAADKGIYSCLGRKPDRAP